MLLITSAIMATASAKQGTIDLRRHDFSKETSLGGRWDFFWMELYRSEEIPKAMQHINLPGLWNGQIVGEDTLSPQGYATYRLKILLPAEQKDYAVFMDDVYCAYQLFANGVLVGSNGTVGKTWSQTNPEWRPQVLYLGEHANQLELVIHIANFHHSKGGVSDDIYFGSSDVVLQSYINKTVVDITLFLSLIILGSYFLIRYFISARHKPLLFFALFCFVYSYRIIGADYYILHYYAPDYPWWFGVRMEYLSLFISTSLFNFFVRSLYPKEMKDWIFKFVTVVCLLFSFITLLTNPILFTRLIEPFFIFLIVCFMFCFNIYVLAVANDRKGAWWGVLGTAIIFTIFAYQIFTYFNWLPWFDFINTIGLFLFLILQIVQLHIFQGNTLKSGSSESFY
jgi:hypothetical protein